MNLLRGESQIMYVGPLPSTRGSVNPDSSGGAAHRGLLPDDSAEGGGEGLRLEELDRCLGRVATLSTDAQQAWWHLGPISDPRYDVVTMAFCFCHLPPPNPWSQCDCEESTRQTPGEVCFAAHATSTPHDCQGHQTQGSLRKRRCPEDLRPEIQMQCIILVLEPEHAPGGRTREL